MEVYLQSFNNSQINIFCFGEFIFFTAKIGRFYINNDSTGLILPGVAHFIPLRVAHLFLLWVAHLIRCHQVLHVRIAHPFLSQSFIAQVEKIFQHQATDHQTDGDCMFTLRGVQRSKLFFKIRPVYLV